MKGYTLLLISLFTLNSCATILGDSTERVKINSRPLLGKIYVNGKYAGTTPLIVALDKTTDKIVTVKLAGYESEPQLITTRASIGWLVLDFICGVVPMFVDAATGQWNTFTEDHLFFELNKTTK